MAEGETMRLRWFLPLLAALALVSVAEPASAMTFRQAPRGGSVVIGPNEVINDNLYAAGSTVIVQGTVHGSVFAAGNDVSVVGSVTDDVWAAGSSVRVGGSVGHDTHVAGNQVSLDGTTAADVFAAASTVTFAPSSHVGRDAAIAAAQTVLGGTVARNVFAAGNAVTVSGSIGGDLTGDINHLTLADGSNISGHVRLTSDNVPRVAATARVAGGIQRTPVPHAARPSPAAQAAGVFLLWLRRLIGLLLFGIIVVLLFPLFTLKATEEIRTMPLASVGLGFAVIIGVPLAAFTAFFIGLLVGGWWIGLFAFALLAIAIAVATVVSALFLGRLLLGMRSQPHPLLALLLGLFILTVLEAIPILGALVRLAEVLFGLGALVLVLVRRPHPAAPAAAQYGPPQQPVTM